MLNAYLMYIYTSFCSFFGSGGSAPTVSSASPPTPIRTAWTDIRSKNLLPLSLCNYACLTVAWTRKMILYRFKRLIGRTVNVVIRPVPECTIRFYRPCSYMSQLAEEEQANCKPFARKTRYLLHTALQVRTCCWDIARFRHQILTALTWKLLPERKLRRSALCGSTPMVANEERMFPSNHWVQRTPSLWKPHWKKPNRPALSRWQPP